MAWLTGCTLQDLFPIANQHIASFLDTHGKFVQQAGGPDKAKIDKGMTCDMCHTVAKAADGSIPASRGANDTCFTCHINGPAGTPHPSSWSHSTFVTHAGGYKNALIDGQACSTCHTTDRASDGSIPPSPAAVSTCFSCHAVGPAGSPHAAHWNHRSFLASNGGYRNALIEGKHCAECHTVAPSSNGTVPPSPGATTTCFSCHDGPNGDEDRD